MRSEPAAGGRAWTDRLARLRVSANQLCSDGVHSAQVSRPHGFSCGENIRKWEWDEPVPVRDLPEE